MYTQDTKHKGFEVDEGYCEARNTHSLGCCGTASAVRDQALSGAACGTGYLTTALLAFLEVLLFKQPSQFRDKHTDAARLLR